MKKWHPGKADEAWKVMICARDAQQATDALRLMHTVLTEVPGNPDAANDALRQMTGKQIVDGLLAFIASNHESVNMAIRQPEAV